MTGFALHLLRHGAPVLSGTLLGRTDSEPTPEGIAACLDQVANLGVDRVITSDMLRASLAAEAISGVGSLPLDIDPRWRELDFGDWDGKLPGEIDPEAMKRFWDDPDANPPPAGERWSTLVSRVSAAITGLSPIPTLIVTHGGAMRAALHLLCGFEQRQLWAFDLPYGALLSLRVWPGTRPTAQIAGLHS